MGNSFIRLRSASSLFCARRIPARFSAVQCRYVEHNTQPKLQGQHFLSPDPSTLRHVGIDDQVMRSKTKADLKKLMSVSDSIADLNHGRYKGFLSAEEAKCKAAQDTAGGELFRPAVREFRLESPIGVINVESARL